MKLKKLQLLGFKTFADKTEIEIGDGLTAVVGPNGSGKSNIVDALLWVLGEQNTRHLRANAAQDVIFAGTDKRKPLGMAEVKLTVDNSDGTLPINFAEVTVTRRIYRSGESQYLLNNSPCRLKDVVELFLDTGVGKGAYSFVSQSEIDAVLSARPEDRRELFEEAAGIKKYRVKKREALRKLESAEVNLQRVRDILNELEVQREPMERQAMQARRFLLLQERLHEIEVGLLVAEVKKADYELYAGQSEKTADQETLLRFDAELARLERSAAEVGEQLAIAESTLESARLSQQNALSAVERTQSTLTLMQERALNANKTQTQLASELEAIANQIETVTLLIADAVKEREEAETEERVQREHWAAQQAVLQEMETAVSHALRQTEARQGERMRLAQEKASREANLRSTRDRLHDIVTRLDRLGQNAQTLDSSQQEIAAREAEAKAKQEAVTHQLTEVKERRAVNETALRATQTELSQTRSEHDTKRRTFAEQSARLNTLTELQENHEGFYQGVRAVLTANKRGHITGHYKAVVDLLTVPEPYRVAIEVALGGSLQDVVTETEAEAKAAIGYLKQNRAGRATFLPMPLLRPGNSLNARDVVGSAGVEGVGDTLVSFAPQYAEVARMLLGRVLVVRDMDTAIHTSRRLNGWSKIVTLEGELLTPGGALTGGSLQGKGAHLVGRKGEMDDLRSALPKVKAVIETLAARTEAHTAQVQVLETERADLARQESQLSGEHATVDAAVITAERDRLRIKRDVDELLTQRETLAGQRDTLASAVERLEGELSSGQQEDALADDALLHLNEETRALAAKRDAARGKAVALEVEVSRLREKREGLTRTLAGDKATLASLNSQQDSKGMQQSAAVHQGEDAGKERERLGSLLSEAMVTRERTDKEFILARDARQNLLNRNWETNSAIKEITGQRTDVTKNLHDTELRLARLEVQLSQALERLETEYSISKEEALARPDDVEIDRNTSIEVSRLRRELRAMGQVNTGAVAEYDRLTERYDHLTEQRTDLDQSRTSLMQTIAEIDDSTRGVFMDTFNAVKREFDILFTRLFGGGSTRLILTNPEDILETGIEVIAQPPGKKPQNLTLLSGGERALTATALLFSFMVVKPSPFVLLDEVDAPLDGANVEKFAAIVKEFSERSQFLLITHNPTTMEAAPTWYGITMKEPGISSVLSYRVPQETTVSESEQAVVLDTREPVAAV